MKKKLSRGLVLVLVGILLLGLCPGAYGAPLSVIFTAVNDQFLRNLTPSTMPVRIDGRPYVPYSTFTAAPSPGLSANYSSENNQLVLYNINRILTFDMANAVTYDEQNNSYNAIAVRMNGTYYVPTKVVCDAFGFSYSFVPGNLLGPIVRINTDDSGVSDDYLVQRGFSVMRSIYNQYQQEYGSSTEVPTIPEEPTIPPDPGVDPVDPANPQQPQKIVYLAFEGQLNEYTAYILDLLAAGGQQATFFISSQSGQDAAELEYLMRLAAEGHTIGNNLDGQPGKAEEGYLAEAAATDQLVRAVTKRRPRLVMAPEGSKALGTKEAEALTAAGYRLWDATGDSKAATGSANAIYNACISQLRGTGSVVLCLRSNEQSWQALQSLLPYFAANNCQLRPITETINPIQKR